MPSSSPRPPPWSASDQSSFAFESTAKRWPTILTQAIDGLYQAASALSSSSSATDVTAKVEESKIIIEQLSKLKHDIGRDRPLEKLQQDSGPSVDLYNSILEQEKPTWFTAAWLFAECYLYRLVRIFFDVSKHWKYYDPFANQKLSAFRSSGNAIEQLAQTLEEVIKKASSTGAAAASEEGLKLTFLLLTQASLWGNATDLSLLTSLTHADIQSLQAGGLGAEAQRSREQFILTGIGALESAWQQISSAKNQGGSRVDIVLDNSGFELVTDLMLGQWLVDAGLASEVVVHAKAIPWFVSDVTPPDFAFTIEALKEANFFTEKVFKTVERSLSRSRGQANVDEFVGGAIPPPAGSRSLRLDASAERRERSPAPAGSKGLQASADVLKREEGRGRQPAGSRSLTMDAAYFQNSRSRTVSPSRSFLVDSTSLSFADLAIIDEQQATADSRPSVGRSASGFRSSSRSPATSTQRLAATWAKYIRDGTFKLSVPPTTKLGASTGLSAGDFWTEGVGYDQMGSIAPQLLSELREKSTLVIFKGDLNYRKLTGDLQWPATTPFETAIGDLAGQIPLLALRTCKADVVVGLAEGVEEKVAKEDPKWRVNGRYAVVEFVAKK